jgi:hypothetical protein
LIGICLALWIREHSTFQITFTKAITFIALTSVFCAIVIIGVFAAGVVGLGIEIPDRTKFIPLFILYFYTVIIGAILGLAIPKKYFQNSLIVYPIILSTFILCAWFNLHAAAQNYQKIDQLQKFAYEWDTQDMEIRNSPNANVRVEPLSINNNGGLNELRNFPEHWVNQCAAKYYGKESIIVCDPHYPDICLPAVNSDRGDMDCEDITERNFIVKPPDPHGLDKDKNGIGCDEY